MKRLAALALVTWIGYWLAGELASRAGGGKLPPWISLRASKTTSAGTR